MPSFNLSLAAGSKLHSDIQASKEYPVHQDPDNGEIEKVTTTKGGLDINKGQAPKLKIDGPLGNYYTEILNRELSVESMGAIVAATSVLEEETQDTGKVIVNGQGATIETTNNDEGYIYIVNGDSLQSKDFRPIVDKLLGERIRYPSKPIGIAMITDGSPSATMESLLNCLSRSDIQTTFVRSGLTRMAAGMLKKGA